MSAASRRFDWHGIRQYVSQRPVLHLYGWKAGRLPEWFTQRFPAEYHRKRLFKEEPGALLHVRPFENRKGGPLVSAPERALLEVLSEVGVRQPLQEARELVESTYSLRADRAARPAQALHQRQDRASVPAARPRTLPALGRQARSVSTAQGQRPALGVPLR